jgi:hypothetical protein
MRHLTYVPPLILSPWATGLPAQCHTALGFPPGPPSFRRATSGLMEAALPGLPEIGAATTRDLCWNLTHADSTRRESGS